MHLSAGSVAQVALLLGAPLVAGLPTARQATTNPFPIADGFPTPNDAQLQKIFRGAHGTLPNTPIPKFHQDTFKSLKLIATNEQIEVSLYEICLLKLKNQTAGFGPENFVNEDHRQFVIATFEVFYQQEEVHALLGNGGLQANGQKPIQPSQYKLNTNTYQDCLTTANILGDNVLGTSQGVISQAIDAGDGGLAAQLDSLIAQEGQQSGFLRSEMRNAKTTGRRLPAAMPAYTASTREFLFSLLEQNFIKPGTDQNKIDIPVYLPLNVTTSPIKPVDQNLTFYMDLHPQTGNNYTFSNVNWDPSDLYLTYISGQNMPFSVPVSDVQLTKGQGAFTFSAPFPAYTAIINGFAIAALTSINGSTATVQQVSDHTIAGPATIELTN